MSKRIIIVLFIVVFLLALGLGTYYSFLTKGFSPIDTARNFFQSPLQVFSSPQITVVNNIQGYNIEINRDDLRNLWTETGFLNPDKTIIDIDSGNEFKPNNITVDFQYGDIQSPIIWGVNINNGLAYGFNGKHSGDNFTLNIFLGKNWAGSTLGQTDDTGIIKTIIIQSALFMGHLNQTKKSITNTGELQSIFANLDNIAAEFPSLVNVKKI